MMIRFGAFCFVLFVRGTIAASWADVADQALIPVGG